MSRSTLVRYGFFVDQFLVLLAYILAFAVAWYVVIYFPGTNLVKIAVADVAATVVIFIFSVTFRNSSFYDPYWSVAPIIIAFYWFFSGDDVGEVLRQILILIAVSIWGIRLTLNWWRGWGGLHHEDWRYRDLAAKTGNFYWVVSFLGIHLFPTIIVFLGCLPMMPAMKSNAPVNYWDFVAFFIAVTAALLEFMADEQMKIFKSQKTTDSSICNIGLWRYSRHPNYLGEILFWMGIMIFALGINVNEYLWTGIGFIVMILLFLGISIPMMEKRLKTRAGYKDYQQHVSVLVPWPGKIKK